MDGFPISRDHWAAMTEQKLLPDSILVLSDEEAPAHYLLSQFTQQKGLPDPSPFKSKDTGEKDEVVHTLHPRVNIIDTVLQIPRQLQGLRHQYQQQLVTGRRREGSTRNN